jgi:hypothetical protein
MAGLFIVDDSGFARSSIIKRLSDAAECRYGLG